MDQKIFDAVLKKVKCDTGFDADSIGLTGGLSPYTISFYGDREDGYALNVEDFGMVKNGKWIQFEPNGAQLDRLRYRLDVEVEFVERHIVIMEREEARMLQEERSYWRYGHPGAIYSKYH